MKVTHIKPKRPLIEVELRREEVQRAVYEYLVRNMDEDERPAPGQKLTIQGIHFGSQANNYFDLSGSCTGLEVSW